MSTRWTDADADDGAKIVALIVVAAWNVLNKDTSSPFLVKRARKKGCIFTFM
jgi:hypothetical protein